MPAAHVTRHRRRPRAAPCPARRAAAAAALPTRGICRCVYCVRGSRRRRLSPSAGALCARKAGAGERVDTVAFLGPALGALRARRVATDAGGDSLRRRRGAG